MFNGIKNNIFKFDWLLMASIFVLGLWGVLMIYGNNFGIVNFSNYFFKQIIWFTIGIGIIFAVSFIDYRFFRNNSLIVVLFYFLSVLLLILVFLIGKEFRGAESWLSFKGLNFQPVELAKISALILFAKYFSKRHVEMYRLRHILISGFYAFLPFFLVLVQPDLGSAFIIFSIWFGIVISAGIKIKHFLVFIILGILISIFAWNNFLADYQKDRIVSFLDPQNDPKGSGYHLIQSVTAVGAGRVSGMGFGRGMQTHSGFLPENTTDFIFASVAEEWGFTGSVFLILVLGILIWRIVKIGINSSNNFARLFSLGLAIYIFAQSTINLGMNLGVLPITGVSLPFMSYGGSGLLTLCFAIGILQNIKIKSPGRSEAYIFKKDEKQIFV